MVQIVGEHGFIQVGTQGQLLLNDGPQVLQSTLHLLELGLNSELVRGRVTQGLHVGLWEDIVHFGDQVLDLDLLPDLL